MKVILISALVICSFALFQCDTHDPEMVNIFQIKHIKEGDGKNFPKAGNKVKVHYTGSFPDTGKVFDSSVERGSPLDFTLARGQVIQCWDQVVAQMSLGEKIKVVCPSRLGYGSRGAGGVIPANADIAFEMELIDYEGTKVDL